MLSPSQNTPAQIDAVITWVDGDDPAHKAKRLRYLLPASEALHENGINPHRWACSDELSYCLRSIETNAPWINTIYIVTDAQTPDLSDMSTGLRAKIKIVDHTQIFVGYDNVLPTFNSLAIESMLWRIEGLAEHFIYFNDDVFLTAPLHPSDVFDGTGPVLRGKWADHSALGSSPDDQSDPTKFHDFMQRNAAGLLGFKADHIFASAHVAFPMRRSVFADLFARMPDAFIANIGHRFRDVSQFQPQGLHNSACLKAGTCKIAEARDYLHLRTGAVEDYPLQYVRDYLRMALTPEIKFLCVNDLTQVEAAISDTRDWIEAAIGPARAAA
jgi:Stealth protein CR2, conserved region 2/Stealth protein CR1, conserved region 1